MSDEPNPKLVELQVARILLKNGQTFDMLIPGGVNQFSTYANRVKNDGMAWNEDIAIPYDSIFLIQRIDATEPLSPTVKASMN